jgi:putative glycosyltransferase (TIGR04372 family)
VSILQRSLEWLGRKLNVIILAPHPTAVGNCAEQIYFGLLKARREQKKLVLLFQYQLPKPLGIRLTNRELFGLESDHRILSDRSFWYLAGSGWLTLHGLVCRLLRRPMRVLGFPLSDIDTYPMLGHTTLWQPKETMPAFSWDVVRAYDWPAQLREQLRISLPANRLRQLESARARLGLPAEAWFACLHVRESGFHGDSISERNATISNYTLAIAEITKRGGWVVRMGDSSMTPMPPMENVIDYPFGPEKSAQMDIYLISACRVYVGMSSGIFDVAQLLQRPIVLTNMSNWLFPYPQKQGDLGVFKHIFSKSRNRYLSIQEWMAEGWSGVSFVEAMQGDYVLHENTPEELRAAVAEFFERNGDVEPTPLQQALQKQRLGEGTKCLEMEVVKNDEFSDFHQRYRLASRLESTVGLISNEYLHANWQRDAQTR